MGFFSRSTPTPPAADEPAVPLDPVERPEGGALISLRNIE